VATAGRSEGGSPPKKNNSLRDFKGVNTQAARTVIGDDQFAWLENVMPVGFGNMPAVPGPSAALATWTGTAYHIRAVTLNGIDYEMVFTTSGALYAVNLANNAVTTVAAAATLSGAKSEVAQWQNTAAVIIDANGYFTWDGTTFTRQNGTIQSLTIGTIGTGYTTAPALAITGGGGAVQGTASSAIQVGLISLAAAGVTYNAGDVVTISGGTFTVPATIRVSSVGGGGAITGFNLLNSGVYTVAPANPAASTSLYGTGATFTLNFGIGPVALLTPGSGYTSTPAVGVSGGGGTGGTVTANLTVVPSSGTTIATYAGRVWVGSKRTVVFSAPNSYTDFTSTAAGGSFIMSDETLHSDIVGLLSANNFLYIHGVSSVNVVADVSVVSGATVFSQTNISASIGSNAPYSIIPYYRGVWFANPYGIYTLFGSTTQKASDDLDGVFPLISTAIQITAGTTVIEQILCLCFMFKYVDPVAGARTLIAVYFNKKWYFSSQGDSLVHIDTAIINGAPKLYATDGTSLFTLFTGLTTGVAQTIVTKLWDMGDPLRDKQSLKFGLELINPNAPQTVTGTIDTEYSVGAFPFSFLGGNVVQWVNNSSQTVLWVNNVGSVVTWLNSGYAFQATDVETVGKYLGVTLKGNSVATIYSGMHIQYEIRAPW